MAKILGLDLGSNSIGWALLESKTETGNEFTGIVDARSPYFSGGG